MMQGEAKRLQTPDRLNGTTRRLQDLDLGRVRGSGARFSLLHLPRPHVAG